MRSCGDGDLESLLRAVVICLSSPERHYAEVGMFFFKGFVDVNYFVFCNYTFNLFMYEFSTYSLTVSFVR